MLSDGIFSPTEQLFSKFGEHLYVCDFCRGYAVGMDSGIRLAAAARSGLGDVGGQLSQIGASKGLESSSWSEIAQRVTKHLTTATTRGQPELRAQQLADLMRLQVDVSNYHLKVEMLSKVAESAVASLRKLQQPQ